MRWLARRTLRGRLIAAGERLEAESFFNRRQNRSMVEGSALRWSAIDSSGGNPGRDQNCWNAHAEAFDFADLDLQRFSQRRGGFDAEIGNGYEHAAAQTIGFRAWPSAMSRSGRDCLGDKEAAVLFAGNGTMSSRQVIDALAKEGIEASTY